MQTATVHALPIYSAENTFEIRRAAQLAGARYIPSKPKPDSEKKTTFVFTSGHVDYLPDHIAGRRFFVADTPTSFDPNDGGRAA